LKDRDQLKAALRYANRQTIPIYGVDAAVWALADAGILKDRSAAVHWEAIHAFCERFPDVVASTSLFQRDDHIATCAGDLAVVDLMMELIQTDFPLATPTQVWNDLHLTCPRGPTHKQPGELAERVCHVGEPLKTVLDLMSDNIEEPLSMTEIASEVGISVRQIERLFLRYLSRTPMKYYRDLRLEHARQLVEQTDMPLTEIAIASGFSTRAQLSKKFHEEFDLTPSTLRKKHRLASS